MQKQTRRVRDVITNKLHDKSELVKLAGGGYTKKEDCIRISEDIYILNHKGVRDIITGQVYSPEDAQQLIKGGELYPILMEEAQDEKLCIGNRRVRFPTIGRSKFYYKNKEYNTQSLAFVDGGSMGKAFLGHIDILQAKGFVEIASGGFFAPEDSPIARKEKGGTNLKMLKFAEFNNTIKDTDGELSADTRDKVLMEAGVESPTYIISEGLRHTFGVELETSGGRLYPYDFHNLNMRCVYDGSLKTDEGQAIGGEYVTGVLKGDMGFSQLHKICKLLQRKCELNRKCGLI
jgi:hypothetical protein